MVGVSQVEQQIAWGVLLDRLESLGCGDGNTRMHQPGIMLGTLEHNLSLDQGGHAAVTRHRPREQRAGRGLSLGVPLVSTHLML